MAKVLPIRPYESRIRERVFRLLTRAGLSVDTGAAIAPGLSDQEVVQALARANPEVMLIPYHAQTDASGVSSNGLELAQKIEESLPRLEAVPILMPVSSVAVQGVRAMLGYRTRRGPVSERLRRRVLLIDESELEDQALCARVRNHAFAMLTLGR